MNAKPPVRHGPWRVAAVLCITVMGLAYISDLLVLFFHPSLLFAVVDAAIVGVLSGGIAWFYQQRQNRLLTERLKVIADMNHHVRNDLQVIEYSAYMTKDKAHIERIEHSLGRIDWALREVLPGKELRSEVERGAKQ
jgi:hypothetical protein